MDLQNLHITEEDFDFFSSLESKEKIEFVWDYLYDPDMGELDDIYSELEDDEIDANVPAHHLPVHKITFNIGEFVLIAMTIDNKYVFLNSNKLKLIRVYIKRLHHEGYMLELNKKAKKTEEDEHKYYKCYTIIGKGQPICYN